jgi:hypothetical protein
VLHDLSFEIKQGEVLGIIDDQLLLNKVCVESKIPLLLEEEKEYLEVLTKYILSTIGRKKYALKVQKKANIKEKRLGLLKNLKLLLNKYKSNWN